ncbi:titin-like [Trifolium pratense]|nr:titin-like [Trifolium pratense]
MMAEEYVHVPVVSDEVTMSRVVHLRRPSAGNNEEKVVPHYRRASIGSCHDFCKYGKNIAIEPNKRSFIPKLAERKQLLQSSQKNIGEVMVSSGVKLQASADSEPTKMPLHKRRASADSRVQGTNASDITKVIKTGPGRLVQPDNEVVVNKAKQSLPLRDVQNSSTYKTRRQEISSISKRIGASSISTSKKEEPLLKSTSMKTRTSQMAKTLSKSNSMKTRTSMNLDSIKVVSPRASLSSKSSQKRIAGINISKSLKTASRVKNHTMPRKVEPEGRYNEVEEKTLYVIIETEDQTFQSDQNENLDIELSSNPQEDQEESKYATSELEEESCLANNGKENMDNSEILALEVEENEKPQETENSEILDSEVEKNEKPQKGETENSEILDMEVEENEKPQKGETENSEIMDLEVEENEKPQTGETENLAETEIEKSSPRKLKFGRGKVSEDNASDVKVDADETVAITGVEKVVLRHQDLKGKKDEQLLSNNMIEETASKLVEIQRSKVKALVGAFETLISLNEKKN